MLMQILPQTKRILILVVLTIVGQPTFELGHAELHSIALSIVVWSSAALLQQGTALCVSMSWMGCDKCIREQHEYD